MTIVMVADDTPDETTCLWPGKIAVVDDEATIFCTDPFSEGNDCWLMVLNSNLGSVGTPKPTLHVGEYYLGRPIGVIPTEQEVGDPIDVPILAIRIEENAVYHVTRDHAMACGDTGIKSWRQTRSQKLAASRLASTLK